MTRREYRIVFLTGLLATMLPPGLTTATERRPVVAVFDIQTKFMRLPKAKLAMLTELLGQELGIGGVYQVMPSGDVKRELLKQSAESYKKCYDEKCQIQLGRQLPANKLVTTTVMKVGGKCRVASSLYDLRRQTTDIVAKEKCACRVEAMAGAVEKVATKLRAFHAGGGGQAGFVEEDLGEKKPDDWEPDTGNEAIVRFESVPEGAVVLVDGNLVCQKTPCSKSVKIGLRHISMQAPRHLKKQSKVLVSEGSKVKWTLQPNFGWLKIISDPEGLEVKVNDEVVGKTPIERLEREPGIYQILVTSPCHYDWGKKVQVKQGKGEEYNVGMTEKQGAVKVTVKDPKGNVVAADVYVDGKKLGKTPGTWKVPICAKELARVYHAGAATSCPSMTNTSKTV